MPGSVFLAGERVELRTVEPEDVPFLHRWSNDPAMRRATGEQAVPLSLAAEERYYREATEDEGNVSLIVSLGEESVGALELQVIDPEADVAELAYWLVPARRGQGYASEALTLFVEYAFEELGLHRLHAEVFEFNVGSARLLDRLGFTEEGRLRENHFADGRRYDTCVFGLLAPEWSGGRDATARERSG